MTPPAVPDLALFVLTVLAKGGLLLGGVAVAAWLLRDRAAAYRHAVWAVGLGALLCLPVAESTLPQWTGVEVAFPHTPASRPLSPEGATFSARAMPADPAVGTHIASHEGPSPDALREDDRDDRRDARAASPVPTQETDAEETTDTETVMNASEEGWAPTATWVGTIGGIEAIGMGDVLRGLLLVWGTGVGALLLWMAGGWVCVRRWIARSDRVTDPAWSEVLTAVCDDLGVRRTIRLYRSPDVAVPMTAGVIRPVILVPARADGWPDARRRTVLMHEVAHVARGDYATNLLARWACALHWVNPLVWWAARKLRTARERACDDRVLGTGIAAPEYADHLVSVAREAVRSRRWGGALAMARPSELTGRVLSILSSTTPRQGPSWAQGTGLIAAVLTILLAVVVLAPGPVAAEPPDPAESPNPARTDLISPGPDARDADPSDADPLVSGSTPAPTPVPSAEPDEVTPDAGAAPADPDDGPLPGPLAAPDTTGEDTADEDTTDEDTADGATTADTTDVGTNTSADPARRALQERAVFAISQMSSDRAVPRLIDIARTNPDVELRKKAIFHLGDHETEDVARTLRAFAVEDADAEVQKRAVFALSQLPEPLGRPQLVEIGRTHPDTDVREKAVYWLQTYGSDEALAALRGFVFESDRTGVQEQAVFALSQTGAETAVPILVEIARTHPSPDVREKAVTSLGQFDTPAALDALMQIVNDE